MSEGSPAFLGILSEIENLHRKKSADYGTHEDPLANYRQAASLGVEPWRGVLVRAGDKWRRIETFCKHGKLENESVEDSLIDLASYAIMALVFFREQAN